MGIISKNAGMVGTSMFSILRNSFSIIIPKAALYNVCA